jgi:uncharacterized protein (DUF3820 family)
MPSQRVGSRGKRWPIIFATILITLTACEKPPTKEDWYVPPGDPIGASATACNGLLARADIQTLLGDPSTLIDSGGITSDTSGSCGLYDPRQAKYIFRFDITTDTFMFDPELKDGLVRPGAIIQNKKAVAFPERTGGNARALVRLPRRYVVVFLRQGPMTAERLTRLLAIASKIAATVPAPFGTAKPTPTPTR